MKAMVLENINKPLKMKDLKIPSPGDRQMLIQVYSCGICRTDLHIQKKELQPSKLPIILGHQIVGKVFKKGKKTKRFKIGDWVGVGWLGKSCKTCTFCLSKEENLCDQGQYTGYDLDGGLAEYCLADEGACFSLPKGYTPTEAAPLLCAGLIGYRCLLKAKNAKNLGIYGFGSAAQIITQIASHQGMNVFAFTRKKDKEKQKFAKSLGAVFAGDAHNPPPEPLDAAIIFASDGKLVPLALKAVRKGGIVICGGIHMSRVPSFPYALLWGERTLCSVANLTRKDGEAFLKLAEKIPLKLTLSSYPLEKANEALDDLLRGRFSGSAVVVVRKSLKNARGR